MVVRCNKQLKDVIEKAYDTYDSIERRKYEVFNAQPMLRKRQDVWAYIRQVIRVTRYREEIRKSKSSSTLLYKQSLSQSI